MIDALNSYVEASFAALSKAQLTDSFSKLAASLGYSSTLIVDTAKLDSAFTSSIVYSTLRKATFRDMDQRAPLVTHPFARLAFQIDVPFDIQEACKHFRMSERALRLRLPTPTRDAQVVVYPVHRAGRLALYVGCSGANPDQSIVSRALLHASAHVLYDRYASMVEISALPGRQADCLFWAAQGKTYAQIGEILGLSTRTVRADLAKAKVALNARTKAEAIAKAIGRSAA
jgi:LuxR family quorum sensing-dependent transcriptional regulator